MNISTHPILATLIILRKMREKFVLIYCENLRMTRTVYWVHTYMQINPHLVTPKFYGTIYCNENEKIIVTRYRVGSQRLKIQDGCFKNVRRENRLCNCGQDIQTINHVVFNCMLTEPVRRLHDIQTIDISFLEENDIENISLFFKTIERLFN